MDVVERKRQGQEAVFVFVEEYLVWDQDLRSTHNFFVHRGT